MKKIYLYSIITVIVFVLLNSHITNAASFPDVPENHINSDAIEYVKDKNIVAGYPDGSFKPDEPINRAEFTKIIISAQLSSNDIDLCISENIQEELDTVFFPDVPKEAWFAKYICAAKMANVIGGYSDGTFKPGNSINFAEAAKVISNGFAYPSNENAVWYKPFVDQLGDRNAIPTTITSFGVNISRGEMSEIIYRLKATVTTKASLDYSAILKIDPSFRTTTLQVYFSTLTDNENFLDCGKTDSVTRTLSFTSEPARTALEQLFLGPSEQEKAEGLIDFWITKETAYNLKRVFIVDGTAYVDWEDIRQVIPNASTSCGSASFLAPIEVTLKQFPTVTKVIHAINGQPSVFYNWIQMGCSEENDNCDEAPFQKYISLPASANLDIPFQSQAPLGNWDLPYQEACEEASIIMVNSFFQNTPLSAESDMSCCTMSKNYS